MKQIKVLHIFGKMARGGAEIRTLEVMKKINKEKYKLDFVSLSGEKGGLEEEINALGGKVFLLKLNLLFPVKFIKLLLKEKYDVVHSHIHLVSGIILMLSFFAGVKKRISHIRSFKDGKKSTFLRKIFRKITKYLTLVFSTKIVCVSNYVLEGIFGNKNKCKKIVVIYDAIDTDISFNENENIRKDFNILNDTKIILNVANFTAPKNHIKIIEIFCEFLKLCPNSVLMLVGNTQGEVYEKTVFKAKELKIFDKIIFAGEQQNIYKFYFGSDVFLFPSIWEGLPGVVLEAVFCGMPIVASDIGCINEIKAFFPQINLLSLTDKNEVWASLIYKNLENNSQNLQKLQENFIKNSPFNINFFIEKLEKLW